MLGQLQKVGSGWQRSVVMSYVPPSDVDAWLLLAVGAVGWKVVLELLHHIRTFGSSWVVQQGKMSNQGS